MWHAEVVVETKKDLPVDIEKKLGERVSAHTDHESVLKGTIHKDSSFLIGSIVCSFRDQNIVYFITKSDARSLTIHIERLDKRMPVRELKASVVLVIRRIDSFLKHIKNKIKRIDGEVFAVGNKELVCTLQNFFKRLKISFFSNMFSKIYVPVATVVASLFLGTQLERSLFNAAVAVLALAILVVIEAARADSYAFSEVKS